MLSRDARKEWLTILASGALLAIAAAMMEWWWVSGALILVTLALVAFFRDPDRAVPTQRGAVVAPADGRISSIHEVDHYEPFDGPATCVRIFLSVFNVHINRSPCHAEVASIKHTPGAHRNALNPESAEDNESNLIVFVHPIRKHPIAAVRQVAGALARTIVCTVHEDEVVQRGQRIGLIKLGSTTELYLPADMRPELMVRQGQKVYAGATVIAHLTSRAAADQAPQAGPVAVTAHAEHADT